MGWEGMGWEGSGFGSGVALGAELDECRLVVLPGGVVGWSAIGLVDSGEYDSMICMWLPCRLPCRRR